MNTNASIKIRLLRKKDQTTDSVEEHEVGGESHTPRGEKFRNIPRRVMASRMASTSSLVSPCFFWLVCAFFLAFDRLWNKGTGKLGPCISVRMKLQLLLLTQCEQPQPHSCTQFPTNRCLQQRLGRRRCRTKPATNHTP